MTPAEKIIVRFYATNTFMFNSENNDKDLQKEKENVYLQIKKVLQSELNLDYSVEEIRKKWNHLCESFIEAYKKLEKRECLTYTENCILNRMFFLRSAIISEIPVTKLKYDCTNEVKMSTSAVNDKINEVEKLLTKNESAACIESVKILNDTILSYNDLKTQRLCLTFILKSIQQFNQLHM